MIINLAGYSWSVSWHILAQGKVKNGPEITVLSKNIISTELLIYGIYLYITA